MKFCVENYLTPFEFHDAEFSFVSFDGSDLTVSVKYLNIHKGTPQNPSDSDMEIASAHITFKQIHSVTYEPGRTWKTGIDGASYPIGPLVVYHNHAAIPRILEELQNGLTVFHFEKEENGGYSIGGCGVEPYLTITFDFDSVTVSWDEYRKKAWYELHRQYRFDSVLHTPDGDEHVQITVICHDEPVYMDGIYVDPPIVSAGCKFASRSYWGQGYDYLWIDAFADLQKHLPEGVFLKCCLTCRHGNFCPGENKVNEVFCTKDASIVRKNAKQYFHLCDDFQPQSKDFYTYNDYLHSLKKV